MRALNKSELSVLAVILDTNTRSERAVGSKHHVERRACQAERCLGLEAHR